MQTNNLLLTKSGHKEPERCHTGNVVTLKPDTRWCSDGFEIRCWNREVVQVVFSLDCCDREAISWWTTTGEINSVQVQDLLTESLEGVSLDIDNYCTVSLFFEQAYLPR